MNYPKKEEYNAIKRLSKKERNTIGSLEEFLDFRKDNYLQTNFKYGKFFIPFFNYYNIIDLSTNSFDYNYTYFSVFITNQRKEILQLKELLDINNFYSYRYQDKYGSCCVDLAGILFKNTQDKMLFLLKHMDIIDTILK